MGCGGVSRRRRAATRRARRRLRAALRQAQDTWWEMREVVFALVLGERTEGQESAGQPQGLPVRAGLVPAPRMTRLERAAAAHGATSADVADRQAEAPSVRELVDPFLMPGDRDAGQGPFDQAQDRQAQPVQAAEGAGE